MIKTIIIDDEQHCISRLEQLVTTHCPQLQIIGTSDNVSEGIDLIRGGKPDLVFLDIEIGVDTGFDLLRALKEIDFGIVFTTAFAQYAIQAFKFSALDYLLKPVAGDDLVLAVKRAEQRISKEDTARKLDVLVENMKTVNELAKKIAIHSTNGIFFVPVSEIIRCEAKINYTDIFLTGNRKFTVSRTLKEFESLLGEQHFFRIHAAHLVNLNFIKSYKRGKGGTVKLEDNTELEVSTRRKEAFLKKLSESSGI